jgi:hypothetical protein
MRAVSNFPAHSDACEWANAQGKMGGLPALLRINVTLEPLAPIPDYSHLAIVSIFFNDTKENGLPASQDDSDEVDKLEDRVRARLETGGTILALAVTHSGARELHFYTSAPEAVMDAWESGLGASIVSHRVEIAVEPDQGWESFKSFTEG